MTQPEPASSNERSDEPATSNNGNNIAVIWSNNRLVHIVADASAALAQSNLPPKNGGVEFFDVEGNQLAPVFDSNWRLTALCRTSERARPALVRRRLHAWLRNVQDDAGTMDEDAMEAAIKEYKPELLEGELTAAVYLEILKTNAQGAPRVWRMSMAACFDAVHDFLTGDEEPGDYGSPWHNALHALGWTHS